MNKITKLSQRFRGLLPIVVDVETAGLNPEKDALLELAMVTLTCTPDGLLKRNETYGFHIEPFFGGNIAKEALEINKIDPTQSLRFALPEKQAMARFFALIQKELEKTGTYRAVLVGHNAWFDLNFLLAACRRSELTPIPFHAFTTFDTASLSALSFGETVLARACRRARVAFDINQAHSAIYDAERTAELFCTIVNGSTYCK